MVDLEYTTRQIEVTLGTDVTDVVLATVAGNVQDTNIQFVSRTKDVLTFEVVIVHLNA